MPIFKSAYDTTVNRTINTIKIRAAVEAAFVGGDLSQYEPFELVQVQGGSALANAVPAFAYPFVFESRGEQQVAIDIRRFIEATESVSQPPVVRNAYALEAIRLNGGLTNLWVHGNYAQLRDLSLLPLGLYATWTSQAVAKRFAIDLRRQDQLAALFGYFYAGLFTNEREFSPSIRQDVIHQIAQSTGLNGVDVANTLEGLPIIANIKELCEIIGEVTDDLRLKQLNAAVLFGILGLTWYTEGRALICTALEHPPTWLAVARIAATDRSYEGTAIGKLLTKDRRFKNNTENFVRNIDNALSAL